MIYFVEDDANIQKLVLYALQKEGYEPKGFDAPEKFWGELSKRRPELVLLDIMLPGEDGLSVLKKLKGDSKYADIPVIMITAKGSEFDKVTGLDAGADDYVAKPFGMTELISRVRAVMRRYDRTSDAGEYRIGDLYADTKKHTVQVCGEDVALSFKEYALLSELLAANGNVVRRDALLSRVWGEYYDESRTLDVHIRKLRVKLKSAGALIQTVKNVGYRLGVTNE